MEAHYGKQRRDKLLCLRGTMWRITPLVNWQVQRHLCGSLGTLGNNV